MQAAACQTRTRILFLSGLLAAILLILGAPATVAEQRTPNEIGAERFLASPGAHAFRAGRYDDALKGFRDLLSSHPEDVTVLRFMAITHYRLGNYDEAIAILRRALQLAPYNAALYYFLGPALLQSGDREGAIEAFRQARDLAPGTAYAQRADEYLRGLGQQVAERQPDVGDRPWDVYLQIGTQYDDNVLTVPDTGRVDSDSMRAFEYLAGGYNVIDRGHWFARIDGSTYWSQHADPQVDRLDVQTGNGGAEVRYSDEIFGVVTTIGQRYDFDAAFIAGEDFSRSHAATTSAVVIPAQQFMTELSYRIARERFIEDGFQRTISSRDAFTHKAAVKQYLFFRERGHYLWGAYDYTYTNAQGSNFVMRAHSVALGGSIALPWKLRFDASVRATRETYPEFVGLEGRETDRMEYSAAFSRPIWQGLSATVSYGYTDENSTIGTLDFNRQVVTFALSYSF